MTEAKDGLQFGVWRCGGAPFTEETEKGQKDPIKRHENDRRALRQKELLPRTMGSVA